MKGVVVCVDEESKLLHALATSVTDAQVVEDLTSENPHAAFELFGARHVDVEMLRKSGNVDKARNERARRDSRRNCAHAKPDPKPDSKLDLALVPATERLTIDALALTGLLVDVQDEFVALKKLP